jgi:hypothetical protein
LLEFVKAYDGVGIIVPDVILAQIIPQNYSSVLEHCKSMMHNKSILFALSYQSDMDIYIKEAGLNLVRVFKEDVNFVYQVTK